LLWFSSKFLNWRIHIVKKFFSALLNLTMLTLLASCSPSQEEIKARGFQSEAWYEALNEFGATYSEALSNPDLVTVEKFRVCNKKNGAAYKEDCEGRVGIFSGIIYGAGSDGLRLNLRDLDCGKGEDYYKTVDMDSWGFDPYEFYSEYRKGTCVTVLVEIEDRNSVIPDVDFKALVSVEAEEQQLVRVAAEKQSEKEASIRRVAEKKAADQRQRSEYKKKYSCVPTFIVSYSCEGSDGKVREQPFCFNLNRDTARRRVEASCKDRHFPGAGANIYEVNETGYTY
jgi:hypothetical protein